MTTIRADEYRGMQLKAMRENADFLPMVVDLFLHFGWSVRHTLDTRVPAKVIGKGFPDLVLAHPRHGIVFAELKREQGKLTAEQEDWYKVLNDAGHSSGLGTCAVVWRPRDLAKIEDIARRGLRHGERA